MARDHKLGNNKHEIIFYKGSLQDGAWDGTGIEGLCVFVTSQVQRAELDRLPALKFIATRSTGFDHIDMALAKERGILVSSVPSYGEHTVAEFAFALLLTLSRMIVPAHEQVVREGLFSSANFIGFDLAGKTIGVIGTGKIGKNFIRIAKGFSMNVVAYDVMQDTKFAEEERFSYVELLELLAVSDIISLHLPENKETFHIVNRDLIAKMKRGITIINTARGSLIDTDALVWGLRENIVAAAGLDVLSEEGYVADELRLLAAPHPSIASLRTLLLNHYLIDHPRVIITPHIAFNTKEALLRILDVTVENIEGFAQGVPKNLVGA